MAQATIELACGLIGIGRPWGVQQTPVPTEQEAMTFLDEALAQSIRYFDTAPAYGSSEARLGKWLTTLPEGSRTDLTIATKFGEHWSDEQASSYVDHSYDALRSSLDQSLARLGTIDVLQLHKTSPDVLRSDDLRRAWEYAQEQGVTRFGASVSDLESGELACADSLIDIIQLPFNQTNTTLLPVIHEAIRRGKTIVVNRPFAMGELVVKATEQNRAQLQREAFRFIIEQGFSGFILTGTKSPEHLRENVAAFRQASSF